MINEALVYAEVDEILGLVDEEHLIKIPEKLRAMIKDKKDKTHKIKIDKTKSLKEQNVQNETLDFLAMLCINYWYENEEEKQDLINLYKENDKKFENEAMEKYNPDNIFSNRNLREPSQEEHSLVEYKENIFKKIWNKLISIFKIH